MDRTKLTRESNVHADRIGVRESFEHFGVVIKMLSSQVGGSYYPDFSKVQMVLLEKENQEIPSDSFLELSHSTALALYQELKRYFGDVHDVATLRKDYEHEKTRVDKFIDGLIEGKL